MTELGLEAMRQQPQRVLIIESNGDHVPALTLKLTQAGFQVIAVHESDQAAEAIQDNRPDLVMVDWDLPGAIALDLIRRIRRSGGTRPPRMIILSMLGSDDQIITGFELGADDYVVKPYSITEVVARVRAVLRPATKQSRSEDAILRLGDLELRADERRVNFAGSALPLRAIEYRVLEFLMRNPDRVFSRAQLLDQVWGRDSSAKERAVDVVVQRLRKQLASCGCENYLQTVRSAGYRVTPAES
jgi:two-component system phosphate regulon response regulator PhoB